MPYFDEPRCSPPSRPRRSHATIKLAFAICISAWAGANAQAANADQVYPKIAPKIVRVEGIGNGKGLQGSGVVLGPEKVATNCHVSQEGMRITVLHQSRNYTARITYADRKNDICVLHVDGLLAPGIALVNSKVLKVGQKVYALGNPKGMDLSMSEGIVSAIRLKEGAAVIQTTAAISPGSSGGGLFDEEGRLVGITTYRIAAGEALNFAMSADLIPGGERSNRPTEAANPLQGGSWPERLAQAGNDNRAREAVCRQWLAKEAKALSPILCLIRTELLKDDELGRLLRLAYRLAPRNLEVIQEYSEAGRWYPDLRDESLKALTAFLAQESDLDIQEKAQLHLQLGRLLKAAQKYGQAARAFEQASSLDPALVDAWEEQARLQLNQLHNPEQAGLAVAAALRLQPRTPRLWMLLSYVYVEQEDWEKTEEIILHAIALSMEAEKNAKPNPLDALFPGAGLEPLAEYWNDLASVRLLRQNFAGALVATDKALNARGEKIDRRLKISIHWSTARAYLALDAWPQLFSGLKKMTAVCDSETQKGQGMLQNDETYESDVLQPCKNAWLLYGVAAKKTGAASDLSMARLRLRVMDPKALEALDSSHADSKFELR